jgi:DNA-directed RNA polymerase subunit D
MMAHVSQVEGEVEDHNITAEINLNITIISYNDDTIKFILQGVDLAFANAIRRAMMSEVPTMTLEDIFFFDNSSIIPDEVIAHRMGLIPIKTDLDTYLLPEKCDCNAELGCSKCRAILTMDIEAGDDTRTVYSGDLIPEDPITIPANQKIPIVKLAPKQAIRLEAYVQLGKGKDHSKWSPVSTCVYQNVSLIEIENKEKTQKCLNKCGEKAAVLTGNKLKIIDIKKFESCLTCRNLIKHEIIMENLVPNEFFFIVESTGALTPKRIITEAVKILKDKLIQMVEKIDRDDIHDEISDFKMLEQTAGKLYSVGSVDLIDEEEEDQDNE